MPQKNKIRYLIIHHTATSRDRTMFKALKSSYNWVITADGVLNESRPQNIVGAHARADGMNYKSLGIGLTGNFMNELPTEAQIITLKGIIEAVRKIYNIPIENVLGHNEVKGASTLCPGINLSPIIKQIRSGKDIKKVNDQLEITRSELKVANEKLYQIDRIIHS